MEHRYISHTPNQFLPRTPARCHRCGHYWKTKSQARFVTCPACMTKVKIRDMDGKIVKT